ncbi:MAG TPA: GTPase Era, partial [Psychrobacter sp.]|nr:GTPase Era [Psychrobacter sp.]
MSNHSDLPLNNEDNATNMTENTDLNVSQNNVVEDCVVENDTVENNAVDNDSAIEAFFSPNNGALAAEGFKTGYVAIVGRPNVGKSTLMNHLLGQKLSITSRKPQTTRHRIHGILSNDEMQAVFVDTPGIHRNEVRAINERMNKAAVSALVDVDLVLFVVDSDQWRDDDLLVLQKLGDTNLTVVLVINKADTLKDKGSVLPLMETFN